MKYAVKFHNILFLVLFTGVLFSCKKKIENKAPKLEIISPEEGRNYFDEEEVIVSLKASDEENIAFIKVGINDENNVSSVAAQTVIVNQKETEQTFRFRLNKAIINTSVFYITVLVNDGTLETKKYVKIFLQKQPLKLTSFVCTNTQGSKTYFDLYNINGEKLNTFETIGNYSHALYFSKTKTLVAFGTSVKAFNLNNFDEVWSYSESPVNNIAYDENRLFVLKSNYYTTAYNAVDFSVSANFYQPGFTMQPYCAAIGDEGIGIYHHEYNLTGQKKISFYDFNTSGILKEYAMVNHVESMTYIKDGLFAVHTKTISNTHQIGIYTFGTNIFTPVYNTTSEIKQLIKTNDNNILVCTDNTIGIFNIQLQSYTPIIVQNGITAIAYDQVSNQIYLATTSTLNRYDMDGSLIGSINLLNSPGSLTLIYN